MRARFLRSGEEEKRQHVPLRVFAAFWSITLLIPTVRSSQPPPHSMLAFTPLAGSGRSEQTRPLCYLLTIDDVNILLDCGSFPPGTPADKTDAYYSALKQYVGLESYFRARLTKTGV